ncbi:tyrosine-type recombinase/integrase [Konateibacter massiliensis]|uniref:tyrosine-type recombinase/integrase n=1 Tax=Konateibacter massiliensis TaxID=2002841 RepID=UPI000C150B96|nr:tyrosine-type recombinase/integrase [Konateibacter massiliensis]
MGKDSQYYKEKKKDQLRKLRELLTELPGFAIDYIHDKEIGTQTSTLVSYSYDLLTFFRFLKDKNPVFKNKEIKDFMLRDIELLASEDIVEYQRYLELNDVGEKHENGKKAISRKMSPLRGLFQYHHEHGYIEKNPMILVKLPKIKKDKNIIRMNNYEIEAIMNSIEFGNSQMSKRQQTFCNKTKKRDLAILTLMLGTGIRVSECAGLDDTDVDFQVNTITIVRKGGGQDLLYFGEEVREVLQDYMELERKSIIPESGHEKALFYSMQCKRISIDAIENLVKKYAKMSVPNKKITPHKLRSTYGTALYRETGDIRLVADVLGHENINTTIDYYAAIEDEHKRKAANAVSIRGK